MEILGEYPEAALSVLIATCAFIAYYFFAYGEHPLSRRFLSKAEQEPEYQYYWVLIQRLSGLLFFGIIPFCLYGMLTGQWAEVLWRSMDWPLWGKSLAIMSGIILTINFFNSKNPTHLEAYPQIRLSEWRGSHMFWNLSTWFLYLLGYEVLFRGILLFPVYDRLGLEFALIVNSCLYSLAHVYKGIGETVGSLILGAFLAYLSIQTGNFLLAFAFHVVMAFSNSIFSFYRNPTMKWQK